MAGRHERLCSPKSAKCGRGENLQNRQVAYPVPVFAQVAAWDGIEMSGWMWGHGDMPGGQGIDRSRKSDRLTSLELSREKPPRMSPKSPHPPMEPVR
jgi:hypothetical protein